MTVTDVINQHSFVALWSPELIVVTLVAGIVYYLFTGPFRPDDRTSTPPVLWQQIAFYAGLSLFYFVQGSPINLLGHQYLFSAHMLQMAVLYMLVPPLLLMGIPKWAYRRALQRAQIYRIFTLLTNPFVSVVTFMMLFSFYHFPIIFDTLMKHVMLHYTYHTILFVCAFAMWWPILSLLEEHDHLTHLRKCAYIISGSVLITPVCALVVFSPSVLYETYIDAPQLFTLLPTLDDQQLGGVIMKLIQEGAYGTGLIYVFIQWVRNDQSSSKIDPVQPVDRHVSSRGEQEDQAYLTSQSPVTSTDK